MITATIKKPTSIHEFDMNWEEMEGDRYRAIAEIGYKLDGKLVASGYVAYIYAGYNCSSLPNYKLQTPHQYGEMEVHIFKNGGRIAPVKLLEQVLMPEEMKRLDLNAGYILHNVNHRTVLKVIRAIKFIASME